MEKSEKKLLHCLKKAELLELVSKIGEEIASTEKDPEKKVAIFHGTTTIREIFSKHIEFFFKSKYPLSYFSAIDSLIDNQQLRIEELEKELEKEKKFNQIEFEEKNLNQPTNC